MSRMLRPDVAGSLRGLALYHGSRVNVLAWQDLATSVRTGEPAFRRVNGRSFFEHLADTPEESSAFDAAMHGVSSTEIPALLASYDFSGFDTIVDVGGGDGTLLTAILDREARPRGVIYDLDHALDSARRRLAGAALAKRIELVAGSFFDSVAKGGDVYLLKHVVHDWSDQDSARILRNCRAAMSARGRLLLNLA